MTREEEINETARIRADQYSHPVEWNDCYRHFLQGARWADKTQVERVLNFIFEHFYDHPHANGHICTDDFESLEALEKELIKAMEE